MKILVVEDERTLREGLRDLLAGSGHAVLTAGDGETAVHLGADTTVDLVLLDLMLPRLHGLKVCEELRARRPDLLILMLTARGAEHDKVVGLQAGADDYVTKPFGVQELMARVEALQRRATTSQGASELEMDGCVLDLGRCTARRGGDSQPLTPREVSIIRLLYGRRGRAVSRAELLEKVWETPGTLRTRTVDMTIAKLRQKIERQPAMPCIVLTVKGVGYAWGEA